MQDNKTLVTIIKNKINYLSLTSWIVTGIVIVALIIMGFRYIQAKKDLNTVQQKLSLMNEHVQQLETSQNQSLKDQDVKIISQVGKLIVLPDNEQPTVATVQDLSKLHDQPFFANARVGDKVLIYNISQKAILYRPSENKIIELAPINTNQNTATKPSGDTQK